MNPSYHDTRELLNSYATMKTVNKITGNICLQNITRKTIRKCRKRTADKQDLIYTLGFELLGLSNESWYMLHAASIEESRHNVTM